MALPPKDPKGLTPPEGTRVDLGDDLLARPLAREQASSSPVPQSEPSVREDLDSVRILLSEGLLAEARRTLFRVLRKDPSNSLALRLMEEIRAQEIEALLHPQGRTRPTLTNLKPTAGATPQELIEKLDQELKLGLSSSSQELPQCERWVREHLKPEASVQDRMDWAVALLHLDQAPLAAKILEEGHVGESADFELQALLAQTYLLANQLEQTRMICERALRDPSLEGNIREEFNYLRARSLEELERQREAAAIYQALGNYRDSRLRLHSLIGTAAGPHLGSREKV